MLSSSFMQIAFAVALLLGLALPLVGSTAVFKRLSSSGDALAHSSLAGVAIGLAAGLNPMLIAIIACIISYLIIELLRKKFNKYSEIGVVVVLSAAIGVAGILSRYANSLSFDSYLFGSILLIKKEELIASIVITALIVLFYALFYNKIAATLYSEEEARVNGVRVRALNIAHSLLLSIAIAISAKIVGSLIVSSMIVLPTAIALLFKKGYLTTTILSLCSSEIAMVGGLAISYYLEWPPGATIVSLSVAMLLMALLVKLILSLIQKNKAKKVN